MTNALSIRQGLSRVVIQVSLAWSLAVFGVVWVAIHHQVDELLNGTLQESAEILFGVLQANTGKLPVGVGGTLPAQPHTERLVWQLVTPDQRVVWRSHSAPSHPLAPPHSEKWSATQPEWHVYGMAFDDKGSMLYVAQPHEERQAAQMTAALWTASGALLVGLACALWLRRRVGQELTPLADLSSQVANYHPLEPGAQPPVATREEFKPVRDAIVNLGERLAQHVASERAFSANAAHALRTPLAGLGAQLALAQRESPVAVQPRIQRAREAADRLSRVVAALLTLFRTGSEPQLQSIDLAPFLHALPIEGLDIEVHGTGRTPADPDLLAAALLNLLDNALRYGATRVQFTIESGAGRTLLRLVDNGPGVSEARRDQLNGALASQRYDEDMGLGLMLADQVARAHHGQLHIVHTDSGFGIELSMATLP